MMRRVLPMLSACALAVTGILPAQADWERQALERLRDSIRFSADTTGILALERVLIEDARAERMEPMHHLRLGILALRLSELQPEEPHLDHALSEFEWAAELRPDWPWPWYGLGLAEARGADRAGGFAGGLFTMLQLDRSQLSGTAFARAIAVDPSFIEGLLEFARVALAQRIDAPIGPALGALRAATATPIGWDASLLIARGRLERLAGHPDSALVAFRRASRLAWRPDVAHLELARTIPLVGSIQGRDGRPLREATRRAYLLAAAGDDRDVVAMIRRDLEPITEPAELATFDALAPDERSGWLESFWTARDAVDLREPGSRLAEHLRRWDVARREFRLPPFRRRYRWGAETWQSGDGELDDRGIVYVRHGEPSLRIQWPRGRSSPARLDPLERNYGNESWRYDRPDGTVTLHFVARDDPSDFKLVETPLELDVAIDQLERHAHEIPGLDRMIRAGRYSRTWVSEDVRLQGRASMAIATQTDSWQRHYREILSGRAQWLAAGVRNGHPLVHIVYALDAEAIRRLPATPAGTVPVRVRASFFDRAGRPVATLDTLQFVGVPGPGARMVAARAEVPVAPGALRVRMGLELGPEQGMIFPVDSLVAPAPRAVTLELSAVLLGRAGQSLPWVVSRADTAWLDAAGVYAPTDTLTLYAEAYGLRAGEASTIRVQVTRRRSGLARLFGSRSTAISLAETIIPGTTTLVLHRELALGGLESGDYALEVTVESGGRTIERRRGLVVR
jgi:GWxTD domain-containing protein